MQKKKKKNHHKQNQEGNGHLGENIHNSDNKQRANLLICKELLELQNKKIKKSNREWTKDMNRQFTERKSTDGPYTFQKMLNLTQKRNAN